MTDYKNSFTIKQWNEDDRPREKLQKKGKVALSDAELIAILIGSGNREESAVELSKRILSSIDNSLNKLGKLSVTNLTKFKGIGEAKAISIITALELGRRRRLEEALEKQKISSSKSVFEVMQPIIGELQHEEFWIIFLNNANKIQLKTQMSKGGITGTLVDTRLIFKQALELAATGLILCHNHPSGTLKPSTSDINLTNKIKKGGEVLDIKVLDHLIITEKEYYSFADEGKL
ncbi:MAG: DNA repair protein RadC [Flavobacteriaceae bacterium]|nr:DNA repair protein RadC [Flavobacteriaceae bacterium]